MQNRTIIFFAFSVLISVVLLFLIWEFMLEFQLLAGVDLEDGPELFDERIKYVVTITAFSAIGLIAPTLVLILLNARHLKVAEALHKSEDRFQRMMAASPYGMFFRNREGRFLLSNKAYEHIYEIPQEVVGKTIRDLNPEEHATLYEQQDKEVIDSGKEREYEIVRTRSPGEQRYYNIVKFPIYDSHGKIAGVGGIISNITERKKTEMALIQVMDELAKSSQVKSTFLAHMSHEMRTPLNAVIGFSKMMDDQMYGPLGARQYEEYASIINSSGEHLLALINDVLDLSKIEAGRVEAEIEPLDVEDLIESSIAIVQGQVKSSDVNLYTKISKNLPHLLADPRMVKQMLLNLLSNAVKFTPENGNIEVRAGLDDDGGIKISVCDDGIGIAEEDIETVFSPYGQIKSDAIESGQGTGLGIPLVVEFLKLHQGILEIESDVDFGTTMTLAFSSASSAPQA